MTTSERKQSARTFDVFLNSPYEFFTVVETLPLHAGKFTPDIETHCIHPTIESLNSSVGH